MTLEVVKVFTILRVETIETLWVYHKFGTVITIDAAIEIATDVIMDVTITEAIPDINVFIVLFFNK